MAVDPADVRAAYYVTGAGIEPGQLTGDLTAALEQADEVNRSTGAAGGYGPAFVVPVMAITYPDAAMPPPDEPDTGSAPGGAA